MDRGATIRSQPTWKNLGASVIVAAALGLVGFVASSDPVPAALLSIGGLSAGLVLFALPRLRITTSGIVVDNYATVVSIPWSQLKGATVQSSLVLIDQAGERVRVRGVVPRAGGAHRADFAQAYHHAQLGLDYEHADYALQSVPWQHGGTLVRRASEVAKAINDELDRPTFSRPTGLGDPISRHSNVWAIGVSGAAAVSISLGIGMIFF